MPITLPPISRRRFLQGLAAATGAIALGPRFSFAESASIDADRLALLSDIHINADRNLIHKTQISMWDHLKQVSDEILSLSPRPANVLVNGDVAYNAGRAIDYATVIDALKPMREAGFPIHLGLGNHDSRENIAAAIPTDGERVAALADRRVMLLQLKHADWYMLDTLDQTAKTPGELGAGQIDWLAKSLDARGADRAAVIMLHHQPDARPDIEKRSGLRDTEPFLDAINDRKQVKAVIFGHTHVWSHRKQADIHFVNLPTTAYVFDPQQPAGWVDAYLRPTGMTLQLHAITPNHPKDKQTLELAWR
jgi:3',5'-cyclic AMP phosphodiesterase CpdA